MPRSTTVKRVRVNLHLTEEAHKKLSELVSPRTRGEFVSNLIMEHVPENDRLSELEARVEEIEKRLTQI